MTAREKWELQRARRMAQKQAEHDADIVDKKADTYEEKNILGKIR